MSSFKIKKCTDKDLKPKDIIKICDSDFKSNKFTHIITKSRLFFVKEVMDKKKGRCVLCELPCVVLNKIPACAKNEKIFFKSLNLEV